MKLGISSPHAFVATITITILTLGTLFAYSSNGGSSATGSDYSSGLNFDSTISPAGLQLRVWLNPTKSLAGENISAEISVVNTLSTNAFLKPDFSANPGINSLIGDEACGTPPLFGIVNFALYQGHLTAANFSQAGPPLGLYPPVVTFCPNPHYDQDYIQTIEFSPQSDQATLSANSTYAVQFRTETLAMELNPETTFCKTVSYQFSDSGGGLVNGTMVETSTSGTALSALCGCCSAGNLSGYWMANDSVSFNPSNPSDLNSSVLQGMATLRQDYHQFGAGAYTLVAEDLWDQMVFAYFDVV